MIVRISDTSFENEDRKIYIEDKNVKNFPIINMGVKSYIVDSVVEVMEPEITNISIGNYTSIAHDVKFLLNMDHDYLSISTYPISMCINNEIPFKIRKKGTILIGNDVWIGRGSTILPDIKIGNGAVIAANSVVTKDIEPYSIVGGNPAKFIKYRFDKDSIDKLNKIKWWYWDLSKIQKNSKSFGDDIEKFVKKFYVENKSNKDIFENINKDGLKKYIFVPNFEEEYSVWENVINQYIERFNKEDKVILILYIKDDEKYYKQREEIIKKLKSKENYPNIYIYNQDVSEIDLLKTIDYYITERDSNAIKYTDYSYDLGINVLFGVSNKIFE